MASSNTASLSGTLVDTFLQNCRSVLLNFILQIIWCQVLTSLPHFQACHSSCLLNSRQKGSVFRVDW